jgi:predicted peptidase
MYASAQHSSDTLLDVFNNNRFYNISDSSNNKLILFLHGGLDNPYFKQSYDKISLNYLIENNNSFIKQASGNNFDLIIPITNDSLNWLKQPQESFKVLNEYIKSITKQYEEIYISGFSDGGTGSYKIFYNNPDYFSGLVVFNGYPQHSNFNKNVDYSSVDSQKVIFFSTLKDKNIPYEFLLTEYCSQKKENADTYFYLANGGHSFRSYGEKDLSELFLILTDKTSNDKTEPIQGYIKNDQLITIYPFRKKIVKKYNFGRDTYEENVEQQKAYKE